MTTTAMTSTHEAFLEAVRDLVIQHAETAGTINDEEARQLRDTKITYGVGRVGFVGVCYHSVWKKPDGEPADLIEISSVNQESPTQLAITVMHELAHVITFGDGHGRVWKEALVRLGFTKKLNATHADHLAMLKPALRRDVAALAAADGAPDWMLVKVTLPTKGKKTCSATSGKQTGTVKTSGAGSGSRLRLYECACSSHDGRPGPWKVRVASDDFRATCDECGFPFMKQGS